MATLLVDADIMCFQCAAVNEVTFQWDEEVSSTVIERDEAIDCLEQFIRNLKRDTGVKDLLFCFSSSPNWRHEVLPTYKSNRKKEKPSLFYVLQDYVSENYPTKIKPNLEADDVMGILATMKPGQYIIASLDKDLFQIPGRHYNWRKREMTDVSLEEADWHFYMQVLTGDPTDGYYGCPGVGPKTAERILAEAGANPWPAIVEQYRMKGLTEDDALVQARVARILRRSDYDFKAKMPKLWVPPS